MIQNDYLICTILSSLRGRKYLLGLGVCSIYEYEKYLHRIQLFIPRMTIDKFNTFFLRYRVSVSHTCKQDSPTISRILNEHFFPLTTS